MSKSLKYILKKGVYVIIVIILLTIYHVLPEFIPDQVKKYLYDLIGDNYIIIIPILILILGTMTYFIEKIKIQAPENLNFQDQYLNSLKLIHELKKEVPKNRANKIKFYLKKIAVIPFIKEDEIIFKLLSSLSDLESFSKNSNLFYTYLSKIEFLIEVKNNYIINLQNNLLCEYKSALNSTIISDKIEEIMVQECKYDNSKERAVKNNIMTKSIIENLTMNTLIAGSSGSGKSTLMYLLAINLIENNSNIPIILKLKNVYFQTNTIRNHFNMLISNSISTKFPAELLLLDKVIIIIDDFYDNDSHEILLNYIIKLNLKSIISVNEARLQNTLVKFNLNSYFKILPILIKYKDNNKSKLNLYKYTLSNFLAKNSIEIGKETDLNYINEMYFGYVNSKLNQPNFISFIKNLSNLFPNQTVFDLTSFYYIEENKRWYDKIIIKFLNSIMYDFLDLIALAISVGTIFFMPYRTFLWIFFTEEEEVYELGINIWHHYFIFLFVVLFGLTFLNFIRKLFSKEEFYYTVEKILHPKNYFPSYFMPIFKKSMKQSYFIGLFVFITNIIIPSILVITTGLYQFAYSPFNLINMVLIINFIFLPCNFLLLYKEDILINFRVDFIKRNNPMTPFVNSLYYFNFSILMYYHIAYVNSRNNYLPYKLLNFLNQLATAGILTYDGKYWKFRHSILQNYIDKKLQID